MTEPIIDGLQRPLTRHELNTLDGAGMIEERDGYYLELLDGVMIWTARETGPDHASCSRRLLRMLFDAIPADRGEIAVENPLGISDLSQPQPDVFVIAPHGDYRADHPTTALLVIEVSVSSRYKDLGRKAFLYASAGIADYWVVDLVAGSVIVHRRPVEGGFADITSHTTGAVSPLALPDVAIDVDGVLGQDAH